MKSFGVQLDDGVVVDLCVDVVEPDEITESIVQGRFCLPPHYRMLPAVVPPGSRVLDLGAHIGTFSMYASALGYRVVAVEASPRNAELLEQSVRRNSFEQTEVVPMAVGDSQGHVEFVSAGPYGYVANSESAHGTIRVPMATVTQILELVGWDKADLIKMDIEGSEVVAIRGMASLLERADAPFLLFESNGHTLHIFGETPQSLRRCLAEFGYHIYRVQAPRLVATDPAELQPECVADYVATKAPIAGLSGWTVVPPRGEDEIKRVVLEACSHVHEHYRAHAGRCLAQASASVLSDPTIQVALARLAGDTDAVVRESVSWWGDGRVES